MSTLPPARPTQCVRQRRGRWAALLAAGALEAVTIALALTFAWLSIATEHPALALAIVGAFVAWALFRATRAIEQRGRG